MKYTHPTWGQKKILNIFQDSGANVILTERQIKQYLSLYFYDDRTEELYYKSTDLSTGHRICIDRDRLVLEANRDHHKDHRGADTIYESLRKTFFPVTRDTIRIICKNEIECNVCAQVKDLPKTTMKRKSIPATYPNSL